MTTLTYPIQQKNYLRFLALALRILLLGTFLFAVTLTAVGAGYQFYFANRIHPGVSMNGMDLSGLTIQEAALKLSERLTFPQQGRIALQYGKDIWLVTPAELGFLFDPVATAKAAYLFGRQGSLPSRLIANVEGWVWGVQVSPTLVFDQNVAFQYLTTLSTKINIPVIEATLGLQGPEVVVHSGQVGRALNIPGSLALITAQLHTLRDGVVPLVVAETPPVILDAGEQANIAKRILSAPLNLTLAEPQPGDPGPWAFDQNMLAGMLTIERAPVDGTEKYQVGLNTDALRTFLADLAPKLQRYPQNARFTFNDDTRQLDLIQHAVIGRNLDVDATIQAINNQLYQGQHSISLVMTTTRPPVTDDKTGADLGISELIHAETSYFYGSTAARIQNIKIASSQFHGYLAAPGETISMADILGDVSLDAGYAEALIILGDQTIKGVGGGVCQVSTTLFRTAFFAGFPITERHAHAYRVGYYEKTAANKINSNLAGLDATVFVPMVDFKFINDTPYWLLMETYATNTSLTWKFYSTSDGRTVDWQTTGPTNITPPPEPEYRENPKLAKGEIKQVDWAAEGADVTVTRTVNRDGSVYFQDEYRTHYLPWRAVYEYGPGTELTPTPTSQ